VRILQKKGIPFTEVNATWGKKWFSLLGGISDEVSAEKKKQREERGATGAEAKELLISTGCENRQRGVLNVLEILRRRSKL